jgi:serine/threonine protein kinase
VLIHKGSGGAAHRLDPLKLLPIVRSVARGVLHLHTRRPAILHRDLKPGNLFIGAACLAWGPII